MTSTSDRFSKARELTLDDVYRAEWGRLLARLITKTRRLDLAEDALSEAFAKAARRWPQEGQPVNPAGWLFLTAYREVIARVRAEEVAGHKRALLAVRQDWAPSVGATGNSDDAADAELPDDRLHLILLCCHPALPQDARSALALRLVMGTSTEQIARLFLVTTPTMAARLTRAKKKIIAAGIPLAAPVDQELHARLDEVCRTIYLAFTAGYAPGTGADLLRADLAGDAVALARVLHALVPESPQAAATLALMLFQHSRRDARSRDRQLVTLAEQDRTLWHHDEIATGLELLSALQPTTGYAEELRLQALISAEHARAWTATATNWVAIADHYKTLEVLTTSPLVRMNRAVAVAEALGPSAGLELLHGLDVELPRYHRLHAVRAELARRVGLLSVAEHSFRVAIDLCDNDVERSFLETQLASLGAGKP
jgi:RNA polymerase sigma-70 factor, ECF subfamily